jgi:hypothetical protein
MEILWPALGISVIVGFVIFVLAQHWNRILRHHSWTLRRLSDRLQDIEEVGDPEFRRRLGQALPSPLEQVFNFSLRLDERFWRETVRASDEDLRFIRSFGSVLGSVKIERWRGRSVATVMEILPDAKAASWRTRTLDIYSEDVKGNDAFPLWELPLALSTRPVDRPPRLELVLRQDSLELRRRAPSEYWTGSEMRQAEEHTVYVRVPLDPARLAEFRSNQPFPTVAETHTNAGSCRAFYAAENQAAGYQWQLVLRDLEKTAEWEQWKILEPVQHALEGEREPNAA